MVAVALMGVLGRGGARHSGEAGERWWYAGGVVRSGDWARRVGVLVRAEVVDVETFLLLLFLPQVVVVVVLLLLRPLVVGGVRR